MNKSKNAQDPENPPSPKNPPPKLIKCPHCDESHLENDLKGQVEHAEKFHPEAIQKRLEEVEHLRGYVND